MSSLAVHLAVSLFFLAAWPWWKKERLKYIPFIMLFGVISDLDIFIGIHRATFHNIFLAITPLILIGCGRILKIKGIEKKKICLFIEKKKICLFLVFALLLLHISLDICCGGASLFYPVSDKNIEFKTSLMLTRKEIAPPAPVPENITQTPENLTETNISGPPTEEANISATTPSPSPCPTPEVSYGLGGEFERIETNTSEKSYVTIPSPEVPIVHIINDGMEFILLISSIMVSFIKYFSLAVSSRQT